MKYRFTMDGDNYFDCYFAVPVEKDGISRIQTVVVVISDGTTVYLDHRQPIVTPGNGAWRF